MYVPEIIVIAGIVAVWAGILALIFKAMDKRDDRLRAQAKANKEVEAILGRLNLMYQDVKSINEDLKRMRDR